MYTSPEGSVKNINSKNNFIFNKKEKSQRDFNNRDKVFSGIFEFISDFNYIFPLKNNLVDIELNKDITDLADTLFGLFKDNSLLISPEIKQIFFHENTFVKKKKYVLKI